MHIVTNQANCNTAFRAWADALIAHSRDMGSHWVIDGSGVIFTNYGHGNPGEITTQVMLGHDPDKGASIVKIVQPKAARGDKGPATVLAVDEAGSQFLLREGRLTRNSISDFVIERFSELSGLTEVPLMVAGRRSSRQWFVVADLSQPPGRIAVQAAEFSNACMMARVRAGGGKAVRGGGAEENFTLGVDEKGRITTHNRDAATIEVLQLQGYVYEALKKIIGDRLTKPKRHGYCVDAMIQGANLLIEIKTGVSAHCIYEAVGQLKLYPTLIGLDGDMETALLIPDKKPLPPAIAAALAANNVSVYFYTIDARKKKPRITFGSALIERCRVRPV